MSTSTTHQQSLADAGSETRPPMLERGSYIPWASHFKRYLNRKRENKKYLNKAIDEGPYEFKDFTPPDSQPPRLQTKDDLTGDDLKHYGAEIEAMNLILISIPNDIYKSVDACKTTQAMWQRVERLMRGTVQNKVERETRFNNEFDQFVVESGDAFVLVYNRFAQLMNDLERNGIKFPSVTINTKFLNCLQLEWLKYVTNVRLAKRLTEYSYDDLFDYLSQYEKLVNASRAKKLEKSHDPLALVAHTGSSSRIPSPYYVTHPSLVVDYDDEYQRDAFQNNSKDPLTSAMMLLARAFTQRFSNRTNNCLRNSSNTINQAIVQADRTFKAEILVMMAEIQDVHMFKRKSLRVTMFRMMLGTHRELFELHLLDLLQMFNATFVVIKVIMLVIVQIQKFKIQSTSWNKMLLAKQDEAGVILTDEQNNFLIVDVTRMEEIKELSANICLMARIQLVNIDSDAGQSMILHSLVRDTEDILDDTTKSQKKMDNKFKDPIAIEKKQNVRTIDYNKLNALYEDYVPQKELSVEQKYFSSTFIPSENPSNASTSTSSFETIPPVASMPSSNPMKLYLEKMENEIKMSFALLQKNSKRESIFYTTPKEIRLIKFSQQEVKPILHELHLNFEIFQKRFSEDIKVMKDVFDSTESALSATWKQNELLNDQLLEAKIKHEIECCVMLSHECVNNNLQDEIKKIQRDSIKNQEGMQK
ncbi:hypothetical protein Tco_1024162 [Tanacetum coccineum]